MAVQPLEMDLTNHAYARVFISHSLKKKKKEKHFSVSVEFRLLDLGFRQKFSRHICLLLLLNELYRCALGI